MQFRVLVIGSAGAIEALAFDAADTAAARNLAVAKGLRVMSVTQLGQRSSRSATLFARPFPLMLFTQELLALTGAGMSIVESLEALAGKSENAADGSVIEGLLKALYEGVPLSGALERRPDAFPALYVASVRASERSGGLSEALSRYIHYEMQVQTIRQKLVSAAIYPLMLMAVGGLVTLFLLGYVVPRFSVIYQDMAHNLPFMSRLLIRFGEVLSNHPVWAAVTPIVVVIAVVRLFLHLRSSDWFREKLWQMPAIGKRIRLYQLARCYRTIGMLLNGGIPLPKAMEMAAGLLNASLQSGLDKARRMVEEGRTFSEAAEAGDLVTPVAIRMLRVGERSGRLGDMLEQSAAFFEGEIARSLEWFTKLFEPILMAIIGIIIGGIVALLYMPIFDIAGSVQ